MANTELKERARATWSAGDYDAVVERISSAGEASVQQLRYRL